jgi:hypothetical protein
MAKTKPTNSGSTELVGNFLMKAGLFEMAKEAPPIPLPIPRLGETTEDHPVRSGGVPLVTDRYSLDEERVIAEGAEFVIRGLTSGTATDGEVIKILRVARLCATRSISTFSANTVNVARREIAMASLALIEALKKNEPRDQRIERAVKAVEAWRRELAAA